MPYNEDEVPGETNTPHCTSLTDELNMQASLSSGGDEAIETPRWESERSEEIRIDREDRTTLTSAVFQDSVAIRAGLIVIVLKALLGVA